MRNRRGPRPQKVGTYGDAKPFHGTLQCRLAPRVLGEIRGKSRWRGYESLTLARRGKPTSFTRSCGGPGTPWPCQARAWDRNIGNFGDGEQLPKLRAGCSSHPGGTTFLASYSEARARRDDESRPRSNDRPRPLSVRASRRPSTSRRPASTAW